ncbi:MAG: hypothetical protein NTV48_01140 [Candidatus Vogelbacteria bacterium]|nr:hypothetical protein [Candidatus Vogelbacteria bacterium]
MKKTMWVMCVLAMFVLVCGTSGAQMETKPVVTPTSTPAPVVAPTATTPIAVSTGNSETLARAFLSHEVSSYVGWINFLRVPVSGSPQWVSGDFVLTKDRWISSLTIDGVVYVAPGDELQPGLPPNLEGSATRYNVNLNGVDDRGQFVVNGSFHTELLSPGDPIAVVLHPSYEERFIPFPLPMGVDPANLRMSTSDDGIYSYDSQRGGFSLWIDPTVELTYEIFNVFTNEIYVRGTISFDGGEDPAGENIVSTSYYGVSALLLGESEGWGNLQDASFDNLVKRDGQMVPAKVIMTRAYDQSMWVQSTDLPSDGRIEVRAWAPVGQEMPLISTADAVYTDGGDGRGKGGYGGGGYYYANLETPVGYDRLVVTITGTSNGQSFYVYLSRGGGKG